MKKFRKLTAFGCIVFAFAISSCKKQIEQPLPDQTSSQVSTSAASACKPTIYATYEPGSDAWNTLVQKWYADDKIQYIKTHFIGGIFHNESTLNIDWGEVTYEGNQVRVRDVAKDKLVFRATLDDQGKPVASYLYNYVENSNQELYIDTSYYYYTGDRLSYIFQLFESRFNNGASNHGWEQYTFNYDASGNVANYLAKNEEAVAEFLYRTPVNASLTDYALTTSFKMLEYLDLSKLFTTSRWTEFKVTRQHGTYLPFTIYDKLFFNYSVTDGLVTYYLSPLGSGRLDYFIGWNCGAVSSANKEKSIISSLNQFRDVYPANK